MEIFSAALKLEILKISSKFENNVDTIKKKRISEKSLFIFSFIFNLISFFNFFLSLLDFLVFSSLLLLTPTPFLMLRTPTEFFLVKVNLF